MKPEIKKKQMSESMPLAIFLTLAGGFQDAYSYNCRGKVFANAQTGNIVLLGQNLAQGQWKTACLLYTSAKYFTLIFHPEILYGSHGSYYEEAYYRPIVDCNTPYFVFHGRDAWTKEIFPKLMWVGDHCPDTSPAFRLKTQHILQDVWALFAANLLDQTKPSLAARDTRKILNLIAYLHEHYQEKFSLAALADHVSMSRNRCV